MLLRFLRTEMEEQEVGDEADDEAEAAPDLHARRPLSEAEIKKSEADVEALIAAFEAVGYEMTEEVELLLRTRDELGRVVGVAWVRGFPVNDLYHWLNAAAAAEHRTCTYR